MNLKWIYDGVDPSIPGNGGPDCASYSSMYYRVLEATIVIFISSFYAYWGWKRIRVKNLYAVSKQLVEDVHTQQLKKYLLAVMCLLFGCELGFKFASRTVIYILNPCHLVTIVQITEVNLNSMLCPAISDPFRGTHYRAWAVGHQSLLIVTLGKVYCIACKLIFRFTKSNVVSSCNGCTTAID
ncbi:hypothetical protein CHUAL_003918 [Chamberlinius hualienensis]